MSSESCVPGGRLARPENRSSESMSLRKKAAWSCHLGLFVGALILLYGMAYVSLVDSFLVGVDTHNPDFRRVVYYRWGGRAARSFFEPIHSLDLGERPKRWKRSVKLGEDEVYNELTFPVYRFGYQPKKRRQVAWTGHGWVQLAAEGEGSPGRE